MSRGFRGQGWDRNRDALEDIEREVVGGGEERPRMFIVHGEKRDMNRGGVGRRHYGGFKAGDPS